jgi:inosine/xanthosine triphosphate pyrophosphatase family protein
MADLGSALKSTLSHRAMAIRSFVAEVAKGKFVVP